MGYYIFLFIYIDKKEKKRKPWVYALKRRVPLGSISGITWGSSGDNFFVLSVQGEHDNLLECRRKTELIGVLKKYSNCRISITDTFQVVAKVGKKATPYQVVKDPKGI